MNKIALVVVSGCMALGSMSASASEAAKSVCNQVERYASNQEFPQQIDKHTVKTGYKTDYSSDKGECSIYAYYEFDFDRFVHKIVDMADYLKENPEAIARRYLGAKVGELTLEQMIIDEFEQKYESWNKENVKIAIDSEFTNTGDQSVKDTYYPIFLERWDDN